MPRIPRLIVFALFLATAAAAETPAAAPLTGFTTASGDQQRQLEARFDALLDPADLRSWMERLSARPHHLGSPWGKANAEFLAELFRSWGYDTRIETFHVLFPTPKTRLVEMIAPSRFTASLAEPAVGGDATSGQTAEQLPIYNVYSADGDVTAELVYVNRGVPDDYEELERRGIDVKGKIAIARYGGSWRGIKPKVAAEHGAIGCIIYSDPRDDGYFQGDVYPQGGWRGERSAQRGSVNDGPAQYTGDPLTPGVGSTESAVRLPLAQATTLTKIPVLPISYADALPLLRALGGAVVPEAWRGGLPITYHFGPGPAKVHLELAFDWTQAPLYNVIATLPGTELPDQWVLRGNHHDAWVNGATDPVSGLVAMMAEAQAIGKLAQQGSRPRRTLVYAAWDGEEPGLLGSTEWVESHLPELRAKAVAYINSDSNSRGFLSAGGSHTLERLVNEVAAAVTDPAKHVSVGERARAYLRTQDDPDVDKRADFRLYSLGSGSDYTPFLQHAGIASLNIDYGGEEDYGQYHSIYDSFAHFVRFMDPEFAYGVTEAKTAGRLVLRLANADLLPFTFEPLADNVGKFVDEVIKLADTMRTETAQRNERIRNRTFELAADPRLPFLAPQPKEPVPHLNFTPLQNALERLRESAKGYDQAAAARLRGEQPPLAAARALELERVLLGAERALTREQGLPQRPWYRHHLYAPGRYTGYSVKTLPGVREAIEQRRYAEAEEQIAILAAVLGNFTAEIDRASALVGGPAAPARTFTNGHADRPNLPPQAPPAGGAIPAGDSVLTLPGLGPVTGTQFAGYAPIGAGQDAAGLFYWFAGPKDYAQRPTILWTNGGPGASSFWGFFLGNGPYEIDASGTLKPRPLAWSDTAGYLMFDQPLSVGLSFADDDAQVPKNVHEGTAQLYQALVHFMAEHPEIRRQPLILAGESYGGTYVPLLAKAILEGNASKPESERIQLGGAILVSAWVAPSIQQGMDSTYAFTHGLVTQADKEALDRAYNECRIAIAADTPSSKRAYDVCGTLKSTIERVSGRYLYNLAQTGDPDTAPVTAYLSRADVRAAIHARPEGEFAFFSQRIGSNYEIGGQDSYAGTVEEVLEAGVKVMVISGLNDAADVNFLGAGAWLNALDGTAAAAFKAAPTAQWKPAEDVLGYLQDGGMLSWVKVLNAGHLAVLDQPLLIELIREKLLE